eukprot:5953415-Pleurochrysis_carterae.AAC.1
MCIRDRIGSEACTRGAALANRMSSRRIARSLLQSIFCTWCSCLLASYPAVSADLQDAVLTCLAETAALCLRFARIEIERWRQRRGVAVA